MAGLEEQDGNRWGDFLGIVLSQLHLLPVTASLGWREAHIKCLSFRSNYRTFSLGSNNDQPRTGRSSHSFILS